MAETTILVVEDEAQVRTLVVRVLQKQGYRVLDAENGREALEIAGGEIHRISLVITDLVMPELGGAKLVQELRALNPDLRFLCMTGYTKEEVLSAEGVAGTDLIQKPFTPSDLLDRVQGLLAA